MERNYIETSTSIKELRDYYEQEKSKFSQQKEDFAQKREGIYNQIIEIIKEEIDSSPNSDRLHKYLETTCIDDLEFLFKGLNDKFGNNLFGSLTYHKLLSLDEAARIKYSFFCDLEDILRYHGEYHLSHPFFENDIIREKMIKVKTLAFLDEIFKDVDNIL